MFLYHVWKVTTVLEDIAFEFSKDWISKQVLSLNTHWQNCLEKNKHKTVQPKEYIFHKLQMSLLACAPLAWTVIEYLGQLQRFSFIYFFFLFKVELVLMSHKKNPAYGRQRISRPMRIVRPIQFWRGWVIYLCFIWNFV